MQKDIPCEDIKEETDSERYSLALSLRRIRMEVLN